MAEYRIPDSKPLLVLNGVEISDLDKQISEIENDFRVREIDLTFKEERLIYSVINSSEDAYKFIKEILSEGIEVQEYFVVLYLNQANKVIGYYKHSRGTINSTLVDLEIIVAVGLKTLAKGIIISHNHPSGNSKPSESDINLTQKVKKGFETFDIKLLDNIIITKNDYYSFIDHDAMPLSGTNNSMDKKSEKELRREILHQLKRVTRANSPNIWARIQTAEGYAKLEEQIIHRVIHQHLVPAAVIPMMESEYEMN